MADVSAVTARGGDRGQLVLVGGIVVALALVALVLLLNTVLFAENVATRGIDPGIDRADDHAAFAEDAAGAVLAGEHAPAARHQTWDEVRTAVVGDVARVSGASRNRSLRRFGGYSNLSVASGPTRGTVLVQNESRRFNDTSNDTAFTLADTGGVRGFRMTVNATHTISSSSGAFTVWVNGSGGGTWNASVYEDSNTVTVETSTGTTCTGRASNATINWTAGTLADCSFAFADGVSDGPYNVSFRNGDQAYGTYRLVVRNESTDDVSTENFHDPASTGSPRRYPGVYSLVVRATYEEGATNYSTAVRVAPDEPMRTSPES